MSGFIFILFCDFSTVNTIPTQYKQIKNQFKTQKRHWAANQDDEFINEHLYRKQQMGGVCVCVEGVNWQQNTYDEPWTWESEELIESDCSDATGRVDAPDPFCPPGNLNHGGVSPFPPGKRSDFQLLPDKSQRSPLIRPENSQKRWCAQNIDSSRLFFLSFLPLRTFWQVSHVAFKVLCSTTETASSRSSWFPASGVRQAVRCTRLRQVHSRWGEPPPGSAGGGGSAKTETQRVWCQCKLQEPRVEEKVRQLPSGNTVPSRGPDWTVGVQRTEMRSSSVWLTVWACGGDQRANERPLLSETASPERFWWRRSTSLQLHLPSEGVTVSVDGEADRSVHLLADEPGGSGVGLEGGAGQDPVGGKNLLLRSSSSQLGLLQLPERRQRPVSIQLLW